MTNNKDRIKKKKYLISAVNLHSDRSLSTFYRFTGIKTHLGVWRTRENSIITQINHYNIFFSFTACLVFTSIQAAPQFWKEFPARSKAALKSPDQRTGTSYEHSYHNFRLKQFFFLQNIFHAAARLYSNLQNRSLITSRSGKNKTKGYDRWPQPRVSLMFSNHKLQLIYQNTRIIQLLYEISAELLKGFDNFQPTFLIVVAIIIIIIYYEILDCKD